MTAPTAAGGAVEPALGLGDFPYPSRRMPVLAARGVVATSQPLAAQAGLTMLQRGGNAVDAALATAIALTVVEPTSNGIGADAFALVWDGSRLHGLNGSGRAPATHSLDLFRDRGLSEMPGHGWLPVTVPGAPGAWRDLHARFGRLPFATLFEPAIAYAESGFPVSPVTATSWAATARAYGASATHAAPAFRGWFETFTREAARGGRGPRPGEIVAPAGPRRARCAGSPRAAPRASTGATWPKPSSRFAAETEGFLVATTWRRTAAPGSSRSAPRYRGYEVWEIPPNGQGIAALGALNILEGIDLGRLPARVGRRLPPADRGDEAGLRRRPALRRRPGARRRAGAGPARQGLRRRPAARPIGDEALTPGAGRAPARAARSTSAPPTATA